MSPRRLAAALGLLAAGLAQATPAASSSAVHLACEPVYLPARSVWARTVDIAYDQKKVRSVLIDGVPVYTFSVRGTTILTALDNERIQIDVAALSWRSDFRGVASSEGRCERG
ncbi:hypothetical protein [Hydrogenophaga sp.]|jgi:hypothetical protein|uniref:hypothetical protein n=1 Tax=Hydrogenophaga sp. TaxID=1904254 RepID=UPI00391DD67B